MSTEINQIIAGSRNIRYKKGDTLNTKTFQFLINSSPDNLTGSTFTLSIFSADDTTESPLITFTNGNGITVDLTTATVSIDHIAALESLDEGNYEFKLRETQSTGVKTSRVEGYFIIELSN